jgi:hypothetical protein
MAKGKNAAALFEVINRGRQENRKQAVTTTPSWWFKGRPTNGSSAGTGNGAATGRHGSDADPYIVVDRDRHLISLRATFATGIIALFAVVVIVGVAFIWGKHLGKSADATAAATSEDVALASGNPAASGAPVVNPQAPVSIGDSAAMGYASTAVQNAPPVLSPGGAPPAQRRTSDAPPVQPAPSAAPVAVTGERQSGLNYVVMQSYPPGMVEAANEAREVLMQHGIPCTVEPAPARLKAPQGWVSVIGTTGFARVSTPDYKNYVRTVENVSAKMAGSKFKKLAPQGYKW